MYIYNIYIYILHIHTHKLQEHYKAKIYAAFSKSNLVKTSKKQMIN